MRSIAKPALGDALQQPAILTTPTRLRWEIAELLAADGHRISVVFNCVAERVDQPAERKLFDEVFSGPQPVTAALVAEHFMPALRSAASQLAVANSAEQLLAAEARPKWISQLQQAANEVGFMCGLAVLAPFEVEVTSPTVQGERLEKMRRLAVERRSADRVEHLARAVELLKQWEKLKADVPAITPGQLLNQINPADRGMMLDTLLMADAGIGSQTATTDLWAVSGSYLVRIDLKSDSPQPILIPMPPGAGPLRSVRGQAGKLLIGARGGVLIVDPAAPDVAEVYHDPALVSEHGFTSVTSMGHQIWACHREGGLVGWQIGKLNEPTTVLTVGQLGGEARNLLVSGLFSVGRGLFQLPAGKPVLQLDSPVVALLPMQEQVLVVSENGLLVVIDASRLEKVGESHLGGRLSGAALLPWLSVSRLLLNRADGPIDCVGLEDQLVTQFTADHVGMRAVTASVGRVAAMSTDRQRIVWWNAWDGRKPAGEIHLTVITRHRIADVAFV